MGIHCPFDSHSNSTLKTLLVAKLDRDYLFTFLVKSDSKVLLSPLFGSELRITGKGTLENLIRPPLPTIPPLDFPFEFNSDFNIKFTNKPKTCSTKGFTTLVLEWTAPQANPSSN